MSEARRLKDLESENAKLKRLRADAMLDRAAVQDPLAKSFDARREAEICRASPILPRDGRTAGVPCHKCRRKSVRYRSKRDDDGLREKSRELANQRAGSAIAVYTLCCAERGS